MKHILAIVLLFSSTFVFSQDPVTQAQQIDNGPTNFWDNVRFGGGLGFGFGNRSATLNISPSAIYDFQNGFALGAGIGYLYSKVDEFRSNIFSPGLIALYNPAEQIQLSAEFEQLFVSQKLGSIRDKTDFPALNFGLAYRTGWAAFGIRYDVLYDEQKTVFASPWSPIIRVYF